MYQDDKVVTGDTFTNHAEDDEYDVKSIISFADEVIDLDSPANNPGCDELGSDKQLYKCQECETTFKSKPGLLGKVSIKKTFKVIEFSIKIFPPPPFFHHFFMSLLCL